MTPAEAAQLLGVPVSAAPDEVARAFRTRAREVHPDRAGGQGDEFVRLAQARDALLAHRPTPATAPPSPGIPVPRFSRRLFAAWIALLVVSGALAASGEAQPLTPIEPIVRGLTLIAGFGGFALTGHRAWAGVGIVAVAATVVVMVVFTTFGTLLGLLVAMPAVYGLSLMGVQRRARMRLR